MYMITVTTPITITTPNTILRMRTTGTMRRKRLCVIFVNKECSKWRIPSNKSRRIWSRVTVSIMKSRKMSFCQLSPSPNSHLFISIIKILKDARLSICISEILLELILKPNLFVLMQKWLHSLFRSYKSKCCQQLFVSLMAWLLTEL